MRFHTSSLVALLASSVHCASATDGPVFFFTLFPTSSKALRDELVARMDNISHWSCTNEPGVRKYALVVPREDDNRTAWSIEQYDSDSVFNAHLAAKPVADGLFAWSAATPTLFAKSPVVVNFTVLEGLNFVKPEFALVTDPYMSVEAVTYQAGAVPKTMPFWRDVVATSWNETGTLAFGVYGDPVNANVLHAWAAYESLQYRTDVHATSKAAAALEANTKDWRVGIDRNVVQKKGGFLYKGTPCA